MLSKWLWISRCYACESWWVILSQWLWNMVCYAVPVVGSHGDYVVQGVWIMMCYVEQSGCELLCVISLVVIGCKSYEPVLGNHGVLCWTYGCESWCVMLSKWLWIMVCHAEQVVVNHGVLCWVSGCELCCAMLVNHGELYWASRCETWFDMLWRWLWVMVSHVVPGVWIMMCYSEPSGSEL